jgi:hypothetical protein
MLKSLAVVLFMLNHLMKNEDKTARPSYRQSVNGKIGLPQRGKVRRLTELLVVRGSAKANWDMDLS